MSQLATVSQHVQTLTAENAAVRREIASLQALLAQKLTSQPAQLETASDNRAVPVIAIVPSGE